MTPRNARSNRHTRTSGSSNSRVRPSARKSNSTSRRSSRSEMSRYSRYSSDRRSYPSDSRSNSHNRVPLLGAGSSSNDASKYSRSNSTYTHASAKKRSGAFRKKAILGVAAALVVALVGCGTALALYINGINEKITTGDKTDEELQSIQEELVSSSLDEPFYMILIGSDMREGQTQSESRSDTNVLVRVDATTNTITLVSIPRDSAIEIEGYGICKFNNAYTYGGAAGVIRAASELCGVEIAHYAEVNFEDLVALVDAVGGVDVEVESTIDDSDAGSIVIEEGWQHLDGEAALVFARSRAYVDGDFTRTANQRKLISAIAEQVLSLSITELPSVIEAAAEAVTTDLSVSELISLAQMFQDNGELTVYSAMVPSVAQYVGSVSWVFVDTESLEEMMEVVEAGEDPSGITVSDEMYAAAIAAEQEYYSGSSSGSYGYDNYDYYSSYDDGYY